MRTWTYAVGAVAVASALGVAVVAQGSASQAVLGPAGSPAATVSGGGGRQLPAGFEVLADTGTDAAVIALSDSYQGRVMLLAQTGDNPLWPGTTTVWEGVRDAKGIHPTTGRNAGDDETPAAQSLPGFHAVHRTQTGVIGLYTGAPSRIAVGSVAGIIAPVRPGLVAFYLPPLLERDSTPSRGRRSPPRRVHEASCGRSFAERTTTWLPARKLSGREGGSASPRAARPGCKRLLGIASWTNLTTVEEHVADTLIHHLHGRDRSRASGGRAADW